MARPRTIRFQLLGLVAAISIPLVALQILSSYQRYRLTVGQAEQEVLRLAETVGTGTLQFTSLAESQMVGVAGVLGRSGYDTSSGFDRTACARLGTDLRDALTFVRAVNVVDVNGEFVCSTIGLPNAETPHVRDHQWFQTLLRIRAFSFGPPRRATVDARWISVLSAPIFDDAGELVGGVAGGIDLVRFEDLLAGVTIPENALVTIVDAESRILARSIDPDVHVGGQTPPETTPTVPVRDNLGMAWGPDMDGVERTWSRLVLPSLGWKVFVGLPTAEIVGAPIATV